MRVVPVAVVLLLRATACFGQASAVTAEAKLGIVEGIVVDVDGKPLPGATVTSYVHAAGAARDVTQQDANGDGRFTMQLPPPRTKTVRGIRTRSLRFTSCPVRNSRPSRLSLVRRPRA